MKVRPALSRVVIGQLTIIDLVATVTLVSLLAAIGAPFIRPMQSAGLLLCCVGILIQLGFAVGAAISKIRTRRKLICSLGERIAVGYCSKIRWKHWPILKNLIALVFCSVLLLLSALCGAGVSWGPLDPLWTRFESGPIPTYIGFIFIWWRLSGVSTGEQYVVCVWRSSGSDRVLRKWSRVVGGGIFMIGVKSICGKARCLKLASLSCYDRRMSPPQGE